MSKKQPPQQQAQPIPQSVVLGLNAWNCASKISNANWETKLNEQVNVNSGDSIFVKGSFIDTRGTASGNIEVLTDTEISLEFYFYWINTFNAANEQKLYTIPNPLDPSGTLTQQVLVGRNVPTLYEQNSTVQDISLNKAVPAYFTIHNPGHDCSGTDINDADGLPYLVYQSGYVNKNENRGPIIPASQIVPGQEYYIHSQGYNTNWAYAGVPDTSSNKLPSYWNQNERFTALANPNYNVDVSGIMFSSGVSLPGPITYDISNAGSTAWLIVNTVNPQSQIISSSQMINGTFYTIQTLGNIPWALYGVIDPVLDEPFVYDNEGYLPPPPPDPTLSSVTLDNTFFHNGIANNTIAYTPGPGGKPFGLTDTASCVITLSPGGPYNAISFTGGGAYAENPGGIFVIGGPSLPPGATGAPSVNNLTITIAAVIVNTVQSTITSGTALLNGTLNGALKGDQVTAIDIEPGNAPFFYNTTGTVTLPPSALDGKVQLYVPPDIVFDIKPVKKKWKMMLKKGSYDPNNLAEIISRSMSKQPIKRVNYVTGAPFGTQSTLTVPTDSLYNTVSSQGQWANPNVPSQNTFYDSKNPNVYDYNSTELDYNLAPDNNDDMPFLFKPTLNSSILHTTAATAENDYIYAEIPHPNADGLNAIPEPPHYFINLIPLINDVRSVSPTIPTTVEADGYYSILPFYSNQGITQGVPGGDNTGNGGIFPVVFGATQTSLLYNNEGNNLFSFNYLHSPILAFLSSASSDLTECTAHMYTTQKRSTNMNSTAFFTTLIDKKSGILLNKMEPVSFWQQLGFNVADIVVDLDTQIGFQMNLDEFQSKTTGGFCGSSSVFNNTFHTYTSPDQPNVADTDLMYLYCLPSKPPVIIAINDPPDYPGMTIGERYIIVEIGSGIDNTVIPAQYPVNSNWVSVGGANPARLGQDFVATSKGFPQNFWGYLDGGWNQYPRVVPFGGGPTITQLQNSYFEVQNTTPINAGTIPTIKDATGHYLIEITGYNSIYLDDNSKREIKSIVSSYYVSANSFVSQPFPDSYNFFHTGAPMAMSNIKIRILDPYTMQEANIGPNSSVYLQINKMLTDQAVAQFEN